MIFESNLLTFIFVCLLALGVSSHKSTAFLAINLHNDKTYIQGFVYVLAAVKEQIQKANFEMIGYEEVVVEVPDFVGHLSEVDVTTQVSEAPAFLAQEVSEWSWAEQVQQPEALVVQEAMVSLQVYLQWFLL